MAKTIPNEEKVFMVSKSTNTTYSGSASLKAMQEWYTMEDVANTVKPYKVFTALLTQTGGDNPAVLSFDDTPGGPDFTIGVTYAIIDDIAGLDVTNIGAPNNEIGTYFIATGIRPINWGEGSCSYNTGAPVATVLENTIGNIWFTYVDIGYYFFNSNGVFTENKTVAFITPNYGNDYNIIGIGYGDITFGRIKTINPGDLTQGQNSLLYNTPIEIRVYN